MGAAVMNHHHLGADADYRHSEHRNCASPATDDGTWDTASLAVRPWDSHGNICRRTCLPSLVIPPCSLAEPSCMCHRYSP